LNLARYPTAAAFLTAAEAHLLQAEVENNLVLGIAHALTATPHPGAYFALVHDSQVLGCAFSSIPSKLGVTRCGDPGALSLLAEDAHRACPGAFQLLGPEPTITEFVRRFTGLRGIAVGRRMSQRIHQLTEVTLPGRLAQGRFRPALLGDLDRVSQWVESFMTEAGESQGVPREVAASRIAAGQLFLWDDREPVSMAAWTGKTSGGVRVNLVYTPPDRRGRGYATACVAELSRQLLKDGNRFCCLYTDLDNPTSNAIYARIGYRPVSDASMYTLAG
jgi:uncharacterized protein